jgi:cell division protein FtsW
MKIASVILVFSVALLLAVGLVMLYSSSMMQVGPKYLGLQLAWCGLGLVACGAAANLDYRLLKKYSWALFLGSLALLALVWVPHFGKRMNGASRWISYAGAGLQPSEFAKIGLIVILAHYGDHFQRRMSSFWRGLVFPGLLMSPVLALIFIEPDRGTAILAACVGAVMLVVAGARLRLVAVPAVLGAVFMAWSLAHDPMRSGRIYSWLHLEETRRGVGMQAYQAKVAFGAGGLTGLGLGNGLQKLGFVAENHTDFILPIIGEELGLVTTLAIVALFVAFAAASLTIAGGARDTFGLLLGAGITCLIGFQAFINIAVVTSLVPNKGMPLPFISYGGSNLLAMLLMTGILLSIARNSSGATSYPAPVLEDLHEPPT